MRRLINCFLDYHAGAQHYLITLEMLPIPEHLHWFNKSYRKLENIVTEVFVIVIRCLLRIDPRLGVPLPTKED